MDRGRLRVAVLFLALVVVGAAPGWVGAAEAPGPEEKINILEPRFDLGIWTLVVFALLLLVLRRWAWGPMLQGLHQREQNIHGALEDAQRQRADAQRLRDEWQAEIAKAHEKVREILDAARRDAQHAADELLAKARAEIQTERERLRREIDMTRDQALQELWNQAAQLATLVSAKAIRRNLGSDDHRRLVDEALAELRQAGDGRRKQTGSVRV